MLAVPTPAPVALKWRVTTDSVITVKMVAPEYSVSFGGPQPVVRMGASRPR